MKQRIILIILACIIFASCKMNINGEVAKKSFVVHFDAGEEGSIIAKIDGNIVENMISVTEGTIIEFEASINDNKKHEIDRWIGAVENTFDKTRARLVVSEKVEVRVIFRDKKPFEVILNFVAGENGELTAKIDGVEVYSGDKISQGVTVNFEALANDGYEVSSWIGAIPNEKDVFLATAIAKTDLNVSVLFTPVKPQNVTKSGLKSKRLFNTL